MGNAMRQLVRSVKQHRKCVSPRGRPIVPLLSAYFAGGETSSGDAADVQCVCSMAPDEDNPAETRRALTPASRPRSIHALAGRSGPCSAGRMRELRSTPEPRLTFPVAFPAGVEGKR